MTATDLDDGVLGDIAAAFVTEAHNIAIFLMNGCKLTRAGADLQGFANLESREEPFHVVQPTFPISIGRRAHAKSASKQCRRLSLEEANKI